VRDGCDGKNKLLHNPIENGIGENFKELMGIQEWSAI
jgi:hypothetical protein